jgi:hypothetical protein
MSSSETTAPRQHAFTGPASPQLPEPTHAEHVRRCRSAGCTGAQLVFLADVSQSVPALRHKLAQSVSNMLAQEHADASATVLTASFKSACGRQIKIGQLLYLSAI